MKTPSQIPAADLIDVTDPGFPLPAADMTTRFRPPFFAS